MIKKAVFNTDNLEIRIENTGIQKWSVVVNDTTNGIRNLLESLTLRNYSTAYIYVNKKYLSKEDNPKVIGEL